MNDKLSRLDNMLERFDFKDKRSVQNYFIGALSVFVDDKTWDDCLKTARNCALSCGQKENTEPEIKVEVIS